MKSETTTKYTTDDGREFYDYSAAAAHQMYCLLIKIVQPYGGIEVDEVLQRLIENKETVVKILMCETDDI